MQQYSGRHGGLPQPALQHLAFEELRAWLQLMQQPSLLRLQENPSLLSDLWSRAAFLKQVQRRIAVLCHLLVIERAGEGATERQLPCMAAILNITVRSKGEGWGKGGTGRGEGGWGQGSRCRRCSLWQTS